MVQVQEVYTHASLSYGSSKVIKKMIQEKPPTENIKNLLNNKNTTAKKEASYD